MTAPFNRRTKVDVDAANLTRVGIPTPLWKVTGARIQDSVKAPIRNLVANLHEAIHDGACLILWGNPGVGKSSIAALLARISRAYTYTALFINAWDLREALRTNSMFDDTESMITRVRNVDVLVIDGLRQQDLNTKDFYLSSRVIEEIIKHRTNWRKLTIITTSINKSELDGPEMPGFREAARTALWLNVTGKDMRAEFNKNKRRNC